VRNVYLYNMLLFFAAFEVHGSCMINIIKVKYFIVDALWIHYVETSSILPHGKNTEHQQSCLVLSYNQQTS